MRSFYRKLNRWGFFILREGKQQQQPNQQRRRSSPDAAPSQFQVGAPDPRSNGGLGGETPQSSPTLAAASARAHVNVNELGDNCLSRSTATKGVWRHPDFYRSRAVECLAKATKTGDSGVFLTVIRPCTNPNARGGDGDGSGGIRGLGSFAEETESEYVEKKKRGRRRKSMKTSPDANIGSSHADDSPSLVPSSDPAAAPAVALNDNGDSLYGVTGQQNLQYIASFSIASHQQQHQQRQNQSAHGPAASGWHNGNATTDNKRHSESPFHYLPASHRARCSDNNVELPHAGGQQYLHQHYPHHMSSTAGSTFAKHDFNYANPHMFENVDAHGGQHPAQVRGYMMGGIGAMKSPQIVGRSQSLSLGGDNFNDHRELDTNENMMGQWRSMERELKVYHQAQQCGMGGIGAMVSHQPVWQPQSITNDSYNTKNPFDDNSNADMPEMVHSPGPHHLWQQSRVCGTGTEAQPQTVWPPYPDNYDYMNNHHDSNSKHDLEEKIQKMGRELKATQQPEPQVIHQAEVMQQGPLTSEDIELAKFFEAYGSVLDK